MTTTPRTPICLMALVLFAGCRATRPASTPLDTPEPPAPDSVTGSTAAPEGVAAAPLAARPPKAWSPSSRRPRPPKVLMTAARGSRPANDDAAVRAALDRTIPSLHLEDMTRLRDAGKALSRMTGVDVLVDSAGETAFADAGGEIDLVLEHPIRLRHALNLLTDQAGDDVAWTVRHGAVFITSKERARGRPKTVVLDVNDLLWGPASFVAPEIDLLASGMTRDRPEPEEPRPFLEDEALIDMIRATIAPGTWDEPGNSIEIVNGKLYITHD